MNHDINVKKMRLNCFRQSKVPGEFMLQMRVPGGMVDAKYLSYVEHIANTWGDGNFHFGTRQTFDITGIKYENIPAVNAYLEQYIKEVDAELCGVNMDTVAHEPQPWDPKAGYPTIGARNITACVGNYHCICGNCNTFELARKYRAHHLPQPLPYQNQHRRLPQRLQQGPPVRLRHHRRGPHDLPPRPLHRLRRLRPRL